MAKFRITQGHISPVTPRDNLCYEIEVERDELRARVALLERTLTKSAAALRLAHNARTSWELHVATEAREYVLFTVMPETGLGIDGDVWDEDQGPRRPMSKGEGV